MKYRYFLLSNTFVARMDSSLGTLSDKEFYLDGEWKENQELSLNLNDALMDYSEDWNWTDYDELDEKEVIKYMDKFDQMRMQKSKLNEHWLTTIKNHLSSINKWDENAAGNLYEREVLNKTYSNEEHLKVLIYAFLTSQRPWERVVPHLSEIDEIFYNYNFDEIKKHDYHEFLNAIKAIKCGNRQLPAQMRALHENISLLEKIIGDFGSIDNFIVSDTPNNIVKKLTDWRSPYRIKQLGEALSREYLRGVGIDNVKPDLHLRRFLGNGRMGESKEEIASIQEVLDQVEKLHEKTGYKRVEIDSIIWKYCSNGNGEICTALPHCMKCVVRKQCKYNEKR